MEEIKVGLKTRNVRLSWPRFYKSRTRKSGEIKRQKSRECEKKNRKRIKDERKPR